VKVNHHFVQTNGLRMHVVEEGDGHPVILCHGFPELWYSWRHQIPYLANAGFRVVVPDMRGYGRTDQPADVTAYNIVELVNDMRGLLSAIGETTAIFVGHDWGALVVWNLAQMAPEVVTAAVGIGVPIMPRPVKPPTEIWRAMSGDAFNYLLYFQEVGLAEAELGRDPRRTLSRVSPPPGSHNPWPKAGTGMLSETPQHPPCPLWFTEDDLNFIASEFERTGFVGGLNWYRNVDLNWQLTEKSADQKISAPTLFIAGENDPALKFGPVQTMEEWMPDLRGKHILKDTGHWTQQERPEAVNQLLLSFFQSLSLQPQPPKDS